MRKIKAKERKAGAIYCSYCRPAKVNATYRVTGFADHSKDFACVEHKHLLRVDENTNDIFKLIYISQGSI